MEGNYEVRFGNRVVGSVCVQRQGLYFRFRCHCILSGDVICRLRVQCGETLQDLGILVPVEDGFGLDTKLPAKKLGSGCPEFTLVPKQQKVSSLFAPVYPEEPFAYIEKIKQGFLIRKGSITGICIKESGR